MESFLWVFLFLSFFSWICGWPVAARFRFVPKPVDEADSEASISIVIPARDEESNLRNLLPSLTTSEDLIHEIIVVSDQSTDDTEAVARDAGAIVVAGEPLPEGWMGKSWAVQQGINTATGDWILALDADTMMEPGGFDKIRRFTADPESVHSICPYHRVVKPYEQLSAFFNVIMLLAMNAFTIKGPRVRDIGLFGQVLLISRAQLDAVGGYESVKGEILENFSLSRVLARAGYHCRCYLGRGTISMRMFPDGLGGLVASWSKGFVSGADNTPKSALIGISFWLSGLIMIVISLTFLWLAPLPMIWAIGGLYWLGVAQCSYLFRHAGSYNFLTAVFFPITLIFYLAVFFAAVRRKRQGGQVQWKGRNVG
ncbi:MAG: glycosyltransferase [Verrucomicrobiota bacterium]